jgi:CDP-glycerol glycerophosphotransferase (TagB/SpsB family)
MATFTFQSGNAAGLRRLPLYALGAVATLLVPRTARIWVFGSGIGPGEGALPLLRLAREQLPGQVRLVWLATTDDELSRAQSLGLDAVPKLSGRGFWLTMRARVLVVTHGLGDVNRYATRGGFVVQLWHGIPLKRLHLDAPVAQTSGSRLGRVIVRRGYQAVGRQIDLFPVASAPVVDRVMSAFGVARSIVVVTGDPRDDVLLQGDESTRRATAKALVAEVIGGFPGTGPVVLYAPTWRDGAPDPAVPTEAEWVGIIAWLDRVDGTLLVRNHPLGRADYAAGPSLSERVRLLESSALADLTPALPAVDHLVTDYSSTAYDFSLVGGAMVFLAVDLDSYGETRGFYESYQGFSGGGQVASWQQVIEALDAVVSGDPDAVARAQAHAHRLRDEHFDITDGRATERVLAEIRRRIEDGAAPVETISQADVQGLTVTAVDITPTQARIEIAGRIDDGSFGDLVDASLDGPRQRVPAQIEASGDSAVLCFSLLVSRWGASGLALPSGSYRLRIGTSYRAHTDVLPEQAVVHGLFRAGVELRDGGLQVVIGAPLTDDERSAATQRRLRAEAMRPGHRRENAVYFESFYGRSASDNPAAIDRVIAREHPDVRRYWSVSDRSIPIPDGATALVEYSREWWRVRAQARVYVINDWLRWTHRRRRGQKVLQTWHGTMLKRLAIDSAQHTPRQRFAAVRQGLRWNAMLAQNDYSATNFRTSYAFRGPIWTTGYPRNDVFAEPSRADAVREVVGIPTDARVVLYAPTWRDDRTELVDYLDLNDFADALPDGHVLLVRGHSRVLGYGHDRDGDRLIDVTTYPDVAELMAVADVLVTDYSSVMFDFAATGKPIVFYTPDMVHYETVLRGFYFDLRVDAPGPVVESAAALLDAVLEAETVATAAKYAERYAAWQQRFTPYDDGHAAQRVVQRMVDEGWLS